MAKYQLVNLIGDTWLIPAPANIGLYVIDGSVTLIDSGNDKDAGRQILKLIKEKGWELKNIVNTHSNADHIGGNAYLQSNTNCSIWTTRAEAALTWDTFIEPSFLWGGYPFKDLRNKFLEAKPSQVTGVIEVEGPIGDTDLTAISLKGHYFDMIGVKTPDGVVFLGDSIFSKEIIEKYHIFFIYDVKEYLHTLSRIRDMDGELFVPSHGEPLKDIRPLVDINERKVKEISETIYNICQEPKNMEDILEKVCDRYNIELNCNQYVLVGSTVRSYLSYLFDAGQLTYYFEKGKMLWKNKI